ncbi:hypothetical protein D4764_14G0004310 [Takifugu flavidus]|uniref:Uncharacterized protein n=1 Tax=Takifugu flavidus TaxID=433684 RepID=A0A5C6P6B9_9TELE|nr:hypothetical protein D4764_14G0004310 [Takifugu flavidus]
MRCGGISPASARDKGEPPLLCPLAPPSSQVKPVSLTTHPVSGVNNVHYHHEQYAEDSDLVGYDDEKYDQDYHSDNR